MPRLTEHNIEGFAIKLLEHLGYQYIHAPGIAHDGEVRVGMNETTCG